MPPKLPVIVRQSQPALTSTEYQRLSDVPPELEWFANIDNPKTRRAYKIDIEEFTGFLGIHSPEDMRTVTRAHVLAWRKKLETQASSPATIRRKLSALSSLFDYLCERNAVTHNPVKGVKRPKANSNEGTTPAISDAEARDLPAIAATGIHMHIGSQITDLQPFRDAFRLMKDLVLELRATGHEISHLDIGGGLGVPYRHQDAAPPPPDAYAAVVKDELGDLGLKVILEPGRMIVGNAGILVSRVVYVKEGADRTFTIVDAAMNDLIRPTLYEAHHDILPVEEKLLSAPPVQQDIVGPVCETGDYLALDRNLPPFQSGDLMAVLTAGAYGAVMASTYNTRRLVPEVMVRGEAMAVVRPRQDYQDLIGLDRLPDWLETSV